ncbi:hypothetical protein QT711_12470 [Sporosarcina saromensis]|uniref:MarR family transcriptional regulator n=1 Tax=Sporosarcina saromensis TaxID=359365 RepID=A0ABU4GAI4_9BACL|nr:hypothetical protein [Sporosarcina saromensis]MDW0114004.1 hypothetical protein [Sporosarcina saromensis]
MKNKYYGHFKFESHRELMKASFHHRNYHEGVLSKEDLDVIEWIVMHNLGYCAPNMREQAHTLFKLPYATIDRSLEKLITLGIIERIETERDGTSITLYPLLPFSKNLDNDWVPEKGKRVFIIDEDFIRFLNGTENRVTK